MQTYLYICNNFVIRSDHYVIMIIKKRLINLSTLVFACYSLSLAAFAECTKVNFNWTGNAGFSADGTMVYDNTIPIVAGPEFPLPSDGFVGPTRGIESLEVMFFDDSDNLLNTHTPVSNGDSNYFFLRVSFNTSTLEFFSIFDVGLDETAGDNYLLRFDESVPGVTNFDFFLFESSGTTTPDNSLDSGGSITITSQEIVDCALSSTPSAVNVPMTPLWALIMTVIVIIIVQLKSRKAV